MCVLSFEKDCSFIDKVLTKIHSREDENDSEKEEEDTDDYRSEFDDPFCS